jgi:hypothetical protein
MGWDVWARLICGANSPWVTLIWTKTTELTVDGAYDLAQMTINLKGDVAKQQGMCTSLGRAMQASAGQADNGLHPS